MGMLHPWVPVGGGIGLGRGAYLLRPLIQNKHATIFPEYQNCYALNKEGRRLKFIGNRVKISIHIRIIQIKQGKKVLLLGKSIFLGGP